MKQREFLGASIRLFARYGVKRTSYGRHSQGGGVARQTLYNSLNNKDAVLRIHIQVYIEIVIVEIRVGLESMNALGPQLDLDLKNGCCGIQPDSSIAKR